MKTTPPQQKIKDFCQLPQRWSRGRYRATATIKQLDKLEFDRRSDAKRVSGSADHRRTGHAFSAGSAGR